MVLYTSSLSSERLCIFSLHAAIYIVIFLVTSLSLPFCELSLVGLTLDLVDIVLQCRDTVGWVI